MKQSALPDALVMPVRRYLHPGTGARVTFIAMIHTAQPQFFAEVDALLEQLQRDGATVLMEAPAHASPDQLKNAKRSIRKRATMLRQAYDMQIGWALGLGLVFQPEHLTMRPEWQVPDQGLLERAQNLERQAALRLKAASLAMKTMKRTMTVNAQKEFLVSTYAAQVKRLTDPALKNTAVSPTSAQMETMRESRVLAVLDQQCAARPDCHVVLVWGTDHLPRFDLALTERGYKAEAEDQWLTAIDVPSFMTDTTSESGR